MIKRINIFNLFFLMIVIHLFCIPSQQNNQLQLLLEPELNHTHKMNLTFQDLDTKVSDYYTTESLGHSHKVFITIEDKAKLKFGVSIEKQTEENFGHRHKIKIEIFTP